jgi:hypothetical protein
MAQRLKKDGTPWGKTGRKFLFDEPTVKIMIIIPARIYDMLPGSKSKALSDAAEKVYGKKAKK